MCGLAHYFEEEGLATTLISLVRPHSVTMKPPRALWVPFELGRPFGAPGDAAFQMRVLREALGLLEAPRGPVVHVDFDMNAPGVAGIEGWVSPIALDPTDEPPTDAEGLHAALESEVRNIGPWHRRAVAASGRTTMGPGGLSISEIVTYLGAFMAGRAPASPQPGLSAGQVLRFAADDLRAFYTEAAGSNTPYPSSRQLADWFWEETIAARVLIALRAAFLASADKEARAIGHQLVPRARVPQ